MRIAIALTCFAGFLGSGYAAPDFSWGSSSGFNYGEASQAAYADIEANNPVGDQVNGCYYHNVEWTCSRGRGRRIGNRCQYFNSDNSTGCLIDLGETNINCQACCTQAGRSGLQQCGTFDRARRSGGPAPPPRDRIRLSSNGTAANMFRGKMGEYVADIDYQGFPSYKKVNSRGSVQYIFAYAAGNTFYWGVSQWLGGLQTANHVFAGITNTATPQLGSLPPSTGWQYHDILTRTFLDDTSMRVETTTSCPLSAQQGLGCSDSGTCAVWCCSQGEGTEEIPACNDFFPAVDYNYDS